MSEDVSKEFIDLEEKIDKPHNTPVIEMAENMPFNLGCALSLIYPSMHTEVSIAALKQAAFYIDREINRRSKML
jgi:hypothetical protein